MLVPYASGVARAVCVLRLRVHGATARVAKALRGRQLPPWLSSTQATSVGLDRVRLR